MDPRAEPYPSHHLRRVVDHVPSMLAYWDSELRCRFANRAYETWFGADPDRLLGSSIRDLLGPALFALNEPYILGALQGEPQTFERAIPGPDGITRFSLAHYHPDVVNGEVVGFIATVTEVTQLKHTEARLQAVISRLEDEVQRRRTAEEAAADGQRSLAVTLASIDAGFIATDRQGRVTRLNAVAERLCGWRQDEARGQSLWQVFQREDRPPEMPLQNPVDLVQARGISVHSVHQVMMVARDGRRTPVQVQAALTQDDDGQPCGLAMVVRDRTAALRAERDASELAAIVAHSVDAIIGKTLDGQITSWNAAAEAMFGHTAAQAVGQPVGLLLPPGHEGEQAQILARLARGEHVPPLDTVRLTRDGRRLPVSITASPIRDAAGRIVGAAKIVRDISERLQADALRRQADQLAAENHQILEASRLKSQFLANMSHELRTPLNAVIGFADLLGMEPPIADAAKRNSYLAHIASSGRQLLRLIDDVLDLSRAEADRFDFRPEALDLPALVAEVRGLLATEIAARQIQLQVRIDPALDPARHPALGPVLLDAARLRQVLFNYLSNAIKFSPPQGRVMLAMQAHDGDGLWLAVQDEGCGIPPEQLPQLFVAFQQLDAGYSKRHAGAGLGLALTRRLVEAQGGAVGVHSAPGQGSVFHALLPRQHGRPPSGAQGAGPALSTAAPAPWTVAEPLAAQPPAPAVRAAAVRTAGAVALAAPRMLVVEADAVVQQRVARALSAAGFAVQAAASTEQALIQARDQAFDGLTLDLQLPGHDTGLGLLASLRSRASPPMAPVVGLTLMADNGAAAFAIADILGKPVRPDELRQAMAPLQLAGDAQACVMVVDDDAHARELMVASLAALGIRAVALADGRQAVAALDQHRPRALVLDLMMPDFDGLQVLDALQRLPRWHQLPVFVWTSLHLSDDDQAQLRRSAHALVHQGGAAVGQMLERLRQWRPLS